MTRDRDSNPIFSLDDHLPTNLKFELQSDLKLKIVTSGYISIIKHKFNVIQFLPFAQYIQYENRKRINVRSLMVFPYHVPIRWVFYQQNHTDKKSTLQNRRYWQTLILTGGKEENLHFRDRDSP